MNRIRRVFAIAGSLIVLLCCGQAIAGPILIQELVARALEKSHAPQWTVDEVWKHLQAGQIADALRLLEVRAAEHRAVASADGLAAAKALDEAARQLQKEKIDQAWTDRIGQTGQTGQIGQNLPDNRRLFAVLDDEQLKVIRPLDDVSAGAFKVRFVLGSDVKQFARNFEQGGKNPQAYRQTMDKVVPDWFNKGKGKRIFLIGAGVDRERISGIKAAWERDGYTAFFYEDCLAAFGQLCSEGAVGAFMGTADYVFVCTPRGALTSRYVTVEADVTLRVRNGGQTMIVMVTPADIFAPAAAATARAFILNTNAPQ
ncbi:MAG TPA: hypothetical protein VNY05_19410 [Candidatus Acidoferrales bacterium]|jgi:hypothetical protein|nr:hypothetical protein [Candidatus Acidoferrales bacterium]